MSEEAYPEDIEIKKTNFKTDQQEEAAEVIEAEWPIGLDTLAEQEGHVEMFYSQVLDEFLGPVDADMTFSEIESEYGSLEQWADGDAGTDENDVEVPDVGEIEPGVGTGRTDPDDGHVGDAATGESDSDGTAAVAASPPPAEDLDLDAAGDVDERRREWFAAGFREGVEFALRNPELFRGSDTSGS